MANHLDRLAVFDETLVKTTIPERPVGLRLLDAAGQVGDLFSHGGCFDCPKA